MANHLSYRSGNPVLSKNTFTRSSDITETMTINGTVNKTAISLFLLVGTGYLTFNSINPGLLIGCGIGGFIVAIVTVFKRMGTYYVPLYAILEGALLGGISYMYNSLYDGIVTDAIFLTVGILLSFLAYRSGYIKPTENFKLGIFAATGGSYCLFSQFCNGVFWIEYGNHANRQRFSYEYRFQCCCSDNSRAQFGFRLDFIEEGAEKGLPNTWNGMVRLPFCTLIWLYLEILRLLAKLNSRR